MTTADMLAEIIAFQTAMIEKSTAQLDALAAVGRDTDEDEAFSIVVQINKDAKSALFDATNLAELEKLPSL